MNDDKNIVLLSDPMDRAREITGLDVTARGIISAFRVARYDVTTPDADGYSEISTRDLPRDVTAWQLAQIIDLTIRAPNYVVRRDFAPVAHLFKPVGEEGGR